MTAPTNFVELTVFTKSDGPLTKSIHLANDGSLTNDSSTCIMRNGVARRTVIGNVDEFAGLIEVLNSNQAIALGALRTDLADEVEVVSKHKLDGQIRNGLIARTANDIQYRKGQTAFALLDFDTKGMPQDVSERLSAIGGFWSALVSILPDLQNAAHVIRRSTSAGLSRIDTGEQLPGSNGLHGFVAVRDGTDIERFLATLHQRCWLTGFGWLIVGVAGQLLDRSIIDRMVGRPERLVFEGPPILGPPLTQDTESRRPIASNGEALDTSICPPLTVVEKQALAKLKAKASLQLQAECSKAREAFIVRQTQRLMVRHTNLLPDEARRVAERQCHGILLPDVELFFTDPEMANCTVADVLADPDRFDGCVLADPIEGVEYGRTTAKIMRRADGTPWINSFAHGRTTYDLKFDAKSVRSTLNQANDPVGTLVRLALLADLNEVEKKKLIDEVALRSGAGVRVVAAELRLAERRKAQEMARERRERQLAERTDPRPQIPVAVLDAPWLPEVKTINEVAAGAPKQHRPRRDVDSHVARVRKFPVPGTFAFTSPEGQAP